MVRLAEISDAENLMILNDKFNGKGETAIENVIKSLENNKQEIIVVAEEKKILVGFVCVQLKKSFCYNNIIPEITEVFVDEIYRRKGIAGEMISFAESYCKKHYKFTHFELLTGVENNEAQALYKKMGYNDDGELHLSKQIN